jgi:diaminopimelate decarboxylase
VDPKTHPYIATGLRDNKFGIEIQEAKAMFRRVANISNIEIKGLACHIGSQLLEIQPFIDAVEKVVDFLNQLAEEDIELSQIDIGGGLGIRYKEESPPEPESYVNAIVDIMERHGFRIPVIIEPGRAIIGNAGIFLTKVEYLKHSEHRNFAIVDAGMNDLLRPALYQGYHEILPAQRETRRNPKVYDIVGPVCESADFLGQNRSLALAEGDLLVVRSAGAYGFVMSSSYNSRTRPPEVIVDRDRFHVARKRETLNQLMEGECLFPR